MIKLHKFPEPEWITQNAVTKTQEYIVAPTREKPSPWRNAEVVATLKAETARKCMYCESIIDDSGYSAVDHIRPRKHFPQDVLRWDNLGLACNRCNTNKGDYWTDSADLKMLNPFEDDVASHVEFHGPMTVATIDSSRARNTITKLKLSGRADLLMQRLARIEEFDQRLRLWHEENDAEKKQLFAEDVERAMGPEREYSGVLKAFAIKRGFPGS